MTRTDDPIAASLTAVQAKRHNLERECEDAVTAAAAPFRERIAELDRAEAALQPLVANGDGPAATAGPPRKQRRGGGRRPRKDSTKARRSPAPDARREGAGGRAEGARNREAIKAAVRAKPGSSTAEVVEATGVDRSTVATHLSKLIRSPQGSGRPALRMEKDPDDGRVRRYYPQETDVAPADSNGAKTGEERKIMDALGAADGPLPSHEISVRTGIRSDQCGPMLGAMKRRGVIAEVPPKGPGFPTRWRPLTEAQRDVAQSAIAAAE